MLRPSTSLISATHSPMLTIRRLEKWSTVVRPRGRACCATWSIVRGLRARFLYLRDNQTRSTRKTRFITRRPVPHQPGNHRISHHLPIERRGLPIYCVFDLAELDGGRSPVAHADGCADIVRTN